MRLINFSRNNLLLIVFLTFCSVKANAQFDTLYAIKYPAKIGFSIFQSKPSYKIDITQKFSVDTLGLSKPTLAAKDWVASVDCVVNLSCSSSLN